jgi:hypothetical protein
MDRITALIFQTFWRLLSAWPGGCAADPGPRPWRDALTFSRRFNAIP